MPCTVMAEILDWFLQPKMIRGEGFDVEVHQVTTADGYILTMHRITGRAGRAGFGNGVAKPAVTIVKKIVGNIFSKHTVYL